MNTKEEIFEDGHYSNLDGCPKCGDKGGSLPSIVPGKPNWILDKSLKDDNVYEYVCGKCFFRWLETTVIPEEDNKESLIRRIQNLEDKYQKLSLNYKSLSEKMKILEEQITDEKIDFNVPLDGSEETIVNDFDDI